MKEEKGIYHSKEWASLKMFWCYRCSTAPVMKLYPENSNPEFWLFHPREHAPRLFHFILTENMTCKKMTRETDVRCYYLFGNTMIIQEHKVGDCPWKKL